LWVHRSSWLKRNAGIARIDSTPLVLQNCYVPFTRLLNIFIPDSFTLEPIGHPTKAIVKPVQVLCHTRLELQNRVGTDPWRLLACTRAYNYYRTPEIDNLELL
jgi:hypothetical protein